MEIWLTVICSISFCAIVMSLKIDFSFPVKYLFISTDTCTKYCRVHPTKKNIWENHEVLLCILVFPVNILVVNSVSYEFAMIGFILKIVKEREKRRWGKGEWKKEEEVGRGRREGEKERRKRERRKKKRNVSYRANYNESEGRKIQTLISQMFNNI